MEEKLKYILEQVNYWLLFAEAKNAMIVVINITLIIAESAFLLESRVWQRFRIIIIISLLLLIISSVIILYSFLPYVGKLNPTIKSQSGNMLLNLIFFGDISKIMDETEYVTLLYTKYNGETIDEISYFELECAHEILYNSRLILRKHRLFRYGLYLTICAIATPIALIVICFTKFRVKGI